MNWIIFLGLSFWIGFFSDLVLNETHLLPSLNSYFAGKTKIESAAYAGLTIAIALFFTMGVSMGIWGFLVPDTEKQLFSYLCLAFVVGYAADWFIYKGRIFGKTLDVYYKTYGVGFWGAAAFLFAIVLSFIIQKYIVPKIKNQWTKNGLTKIRLKI